MSEREPAGVDQVGAEHVRAATERLRERLDACGGGAVEVVAVTKGFGVDAVVAAQEAGHRALGENYAQELVGKARELSDTAAGGGRGGPGPSWHFIGRLQRNKVGRIAPLVVLWQSVDRLSLGGAIARHAPGAEVLVQVNLSGEEQKGGCAFDDVAALVEGLRELGLGVVGLMGVGPAGEPEESRAPFRALTRKADELDLAVRSIGMSSDLEVAVAEGSTMVRVGRDLFGPRPPRS